jgi:hypothetical protein
MRDMSDLIWELWHGAASGIPCWNPLHNPGLKRLRPAAHSMSLLSVELMNGRRIFLEGAYLRDTYAGLLEGRPSASVNSFELESHIHVIKKMWPGAPSFVLRRDDYIRNLDKPLPKYKWVGHLVSSSPIHDQKRASSHLVVVWYSDHLESSLWEDLAQELRCLRWNELASDCDYF